MAVWWAAGLRVVAGGVMGVLSTTSSVGIGWFADTQSDDGVHFARSAVVPSRSL